MNFWTYKNLFGFGVSPFGVVDIWWVETAKWHTPGVYTGTKGFHENLFARLYAG